MFPEKVNDAQMIGIEELLLPQNGHFSGETKVFINTWNSCDVVALPGTGKTTAILAKLKILADQMPFEKNRGVCILSHTNVAINEIKNRLKNDSNKIISYPNWVGTIHSFICQFITFPYLRNKKRLVATCVDETTYYNCYFNEICKNHFLLKTFKNMYKQDNKQFKDSVISFVKTARITGEGVIKNGKIKWGKDTSSFYNYIQTMQKFFNTGLITYNEALEYSVEALKDYPIYRKLISLRFKFVFIDEYQDCSELQRKIIETTFDTTVVNVFKVGDPNQAIFSGNNDIKEEAWEKPLNSLNIFQSNRFGTSISKILNSIIAPNLEVCSSCFVNSFQPILFVYDESSINNVLPSFAKLLKELNFKDTKAIYKAIGLRKEKTDKACAIESYWDGFNSEITKKESYWDLLEIIIIELKNGRIDLVDKYLKKILCYLYLLDDVKFCNKRITPNNIRSFFEKEKKLEHYRILLLSIVKDNVDDESKLDQFLLVEGHKLGLNNSIKEKKDSFFTKRDNNTLKSNDNVYCDLGTGFRISVSTIHGVKGETHEATLFLETSYYSKTDIERVYPLEINKVNDAIDYYHRCVFVGFSRPRKLLCLAIKKSTYIEREKYFSDWDVRYV